MKKNMLLLTAKSARNVLSRWLNENKFEFCAHEHAIVRECRLINQSSVVLLTSSGYFTLGEIKGKPQLVKISLVV